jgi:hypothetical protein
MSGDTIVLLKAVAGGVMAVAGVLVFRWSGWRSLRRAAFRRGFFGCLLLTRVGLFALVFGAAGLPVQSDVAGYYYPQARAALAGLVPYRDFSTSYGVAFPYLAALPVAAWNAPESLVAAAIAIELASASLWFKLGARIAGETTLRAAALLYAFSPLPLLNVAVSGQNQVWVSAGLALALGALVARREVLSGLAIGLTAIAVKFLVLLFSPALGLASRRRFRWGAGCAAAPVATLAIAPVAALDLREPLRLEAVRRSSGNAWLLLDAFGVGGSSVNVRLCVTAVLVGTAAVVLALASRRVRRDGLWATRAITLMLAAFLLVSWKSYTHYLVMAFFPVCVTVAASGVTVGRAAMFGAFGAIAVVEPALWFRWMHERVVRPADLEMAGAPWAVLGFWLVELALVAGYAWVAACAWRGIAGAGRDRCAAESRAW